MLRRKIDPTYLKFLFEYKVHNPKGYLEEDEVESSNEIEYIDDQEETQGEQDIDNIEDESEVTEDEVESVEDSESDIERVKKIQDIQTEKIESTEQRAEEISSEISQINDKLSYFDSLNDKLELIYRQVKELTPPTPQESLHKQADLIGGQTPEEYFQEYEKKHTPIKQVRQYSDSEIKDSLFKK